MTSRAILRLFALSVTLALSNRIEAQSDFRDGFIISLQGDTVRGRISYGGHIYERCYFKTTSGEETTYAPAEIMAYGFTGDRYFESREITIDKQKQTVFLEVLIRGKASLYTYKHYFFIQKGDDFQELKNEVTEVVKDGVLQRKNSNHHIGILSYMLIPDCPEIKERIQRTQLTEKGLTSILERYNVCVGESVKSYKAERPWLQIGLGVSAGFAISSMEVETKLSDFIEIVGKYRKSKNVVGGIEMELSSPRVNEHISFSVGAIYHSMSFSITNVNSAGAIQRNNVWVDVDQLKMPIGLRYKFHGKVAPFINGGILSAFNLKTKSTWIEEVEYQNSVTTKEHEIYLAMKKRQSGFWAGAGLSTPISKKLRGTAEFRYEVLRGPMHNFLPSTTNNVQVLVGVRF